jgi:hypothetical protein
MSSDYRNGVSDTVIKHIPFLYLDEHFRAKLFPS